MRESKAMTLRLPVDVWRKLKVQAERERRSLHGHIVYLLSKAVEGER